ncbi:MAG: hypothetical protein IAI48_11760 [Candidatus Eremiobacteraeota bacterium]|nr:hypothetical protein [Candidatus Eremiobacteraeota bacterium]
MATAEALAFGEAVAETVTAGVGVTVATADGDTVGMLDAITCGVPPPPLHAPSAAAATTAQKSAGEKRCTTDLRFEGFMDSSASKSPARSVSTLL